MANFIEGSKPTRTGSRRLIGAIIYGRLRCKYGPDRLQESLIRRPLSLLLVKRGNGPMRIYSPLPMGISTPQSAVAPLLNSSVVDSASCLAPAAYGSHTESGAFQVQVSLHQRLLHARHDPPGLQKQFIHDVTSTESSYEVFTMR